MKKIVKISDDSGLVFELDNWESMQKQTVFNYFQGKYKEINNEIEKFNDDLYWNKIITNSNTNMTIIIGRSYFLYKKIDSYFLSLISPQEWKKPLKDIEFVDIFIKSSNGLWKKHKI